MTNNFTKYKKIIDYFRGEVAAKDFESKFAAQSANIPKSDRFLLKMELKRLASPCIRLVDLRGLVDGDCKQFTHEERIHFLDDVAIKVFEENFKAYKGYTVGVYEAVTNTENNFRVIYQKEKAGLNVVKNKEKPAQKSLEKTQYPAKFYKFGDYYNRIEERMNFSIPLLLTSGGEQIKCQSSDLSVNGCRFRLPSTSKMVIGDVLSIRFLGLEEEFAFGTKDIFNYEVKNVQLIDSEQLVGVKRVYIENNTRDGFKDFLRGFIQGNKRRYKINLDNTISALLTRNFEQYVLPQSSDLPVFLSNKENGFLPQYALTSLNNHKIFEYWQDESKQSTLHFLITPARLEQLKKLYTLGKSLLVYSFIHHSQGKDFFYTADENQLRNHADCITDFLSFAANKPEFAITELSLSPINKEKVNSFYTLSDSLTTKDKYLNLPVEQESLDKVNALSYLVIVNDITNECSTTTYQNLSSEKADASKIKVFGHKRTKSALKVSEIGIQYQNHRKEPRFKYTTSVHVNSEGSIWEAQSVDFSPSGMKVELEKPVPLNKGDTVSLTFPDLQKITSSFDLKSLPYSIVRINEKKTIINIRVQVDKHQHMGKAFFKALIEKNKDKLTPDEYESIVQSLVKPLRNLYSSSSITPYLIIQTSGSRYKFEAIGCGQETGKLMPLMRELSDNVEAYNLYPVLNNLHLTNSLMTNLKKARTSDAPITETVYIAINPNNNWSNNKVVAKTESELKTLKLQKMFMDNALKSGHFLCLKLSLTRTNAPEMDYINPELNYISSYAIHRGKQIEQEVWSVAGVVQLLDITQEVIMRLKLGT